MQGREFYPETPGMEAVLATADRLLPEFQRAIEGIPEDDRRSGISLSEMFLFYAVVRPLNPRQILESGRHLGGSTLNLAHCFPDARIFSVEYDAEAPAAAIAVEKLAPHRHVECLFGDSRELLPKLMQQGDAILIDGPKDFRALKLALKLLRTRKPGVIFMHDFGASLPWRRFLDKHWPGAFFSDHPEFLRRFGWLDGLGDAPRPSTFACLPARLPAPYLVLLMLAVCARMVSLGPSKIRRALGLPAAG